MILELQDNLAVFMAVELGLSIAGELVANQTCNPFLPCLVEKLCVLVTDDLLPKVWL